MSIWKGVVVGSGGKDLKRGVGSYLDTTHCVIGSKLPGSTDIQQPTRGYQAQFGRTERYIWPYTHTPDHIKAGM